ncbi:copper chaperone [Blastocladiella emersonii ATCC 22665]|nr:copper chaperone [Blastocladiella emersonii ATCC 22665]
MNMTLVTEFAVNMTCASCEQSVRSALAGVAGIETVDVSIPEKRVVVKGNVPASTLFTVLRDTGLATVVRGQGRAGHNHAAVAVLDASNIVHDPTRPFGVVRMAQLRADAPGVLVDATATGLVPGEVYDVAVTEAGDLSAGGLAGLGKDVVLVASGTADASGRLEAVGQPPAWLWEWIGHGVAVRARTLRATGEGVHSLGGIVARSAGAFENDKVVCACSGRTLWEEKLGWIPSAESAAAAAKV